MRRLSLCLALLIAFPLAAAAQGGGGAGRGTSGGGGQEEPRYDKAAVATFTGVVSGLSSHTGKRGTPRSRVTLKTAEGTVLVHIGPAAYLDAMKFHPVVGDRLTVLGSKVKEDNGEEMVIVRQITRGAEVLLMRNEDGRPLWDEKYKGH